MSTRCECEIYQRTGPWHIPSWGGRKNFRTSKLSIRDFEVFTEAKFHVEAFWVVTPCSVEVGTTLKMETDKSSETMEFYYNTKRRHNPEHLDLNSKLVCSTLPSECYVRALGTVLRLRVPLTAVCEVHECVSKSFRTGRLERASGTALCH
jgi:hypothetical protein